MAATETIEIQQDSINGGSPVRVLGGSATVSGTKSNESTPSENVSGPSKVQTQSYENLKIKLDSVHLTGESGTLTVQDVFTLYKLKYDDTNAPVLTIKDFNGSVFPDLNGDTNGIKVILDDFDINIDLNDLDSSDRAVATLTFTETA